MEGRIWRPFALKYDISHDLAWENAMEKIAIAAIAKNEGKYIIEWLAYHLAIKFDEILVFCNDSMDDMCDKLVRIAVEDHRVKVIDWPSRAGVSPQLSAYREATRISSADWIVFIDIDEFIVPFDHSNIKDWLNSIPADVSAVALNWRGFGSSGITDESYEFVTQTFTKCSERDWDNNLHFKTIARRSKLASVLIHQAVPSEGRYVLSDLQDLCMRNIGSSTRVVHNGIQINHYQSKTWTEFERRMKRGNANFPAGHPQHLRDAGFERFQALDRNEQEDLAIRKYDAAMQTEYRRLSKIIAGS